MLGLGSHLNRLRSKTLCNNPKKWEAEGSPRKIAEHVSKAAPIEKDVLIDCFAGVGGNVIAFATTRRWSQIYAIEKNSAVLACAKQNAHIYGVAEMITWLHGDCFEILQRGLADIPAARTVLFASPPWGG